jgi:hypothetical protein
VDDQQMKEHHLFHSPEFHYKQGLSGRQLERIAQETADLVNSQKKM